jgi:molybdopterin-guanine dinucleotide biosynthesis protein A
VLDRVLPLSDDVVIVANEPEKYGRFGARVVADVIPGQGALGGIYSGLLAAKHELALAVACDMPFLNGELLRAMARAAPRFDVVMPRLVAPIATPPPSPPPSTGEGREGGPTAREENLHPLHAFYARSCIDPIAYLLRRGDLRLIAFLDRVRVRYFEPAEIDPFDAQHRSFFNVNTLADLEHAKAISGRLPKSPRLRES